MIYGKRPKPDFKKSDTKSIGNIYYNFKKHEEDIVHRIDIKNIYDIDINKPSGIAENGCLVWTF